MFPAFLAIRRFDDVSEGPLYEQVQDFAGFWGSMFTQYLSMIILMAWTWHKVVCKNHAQNFTVCYLCCMGEVDDDGEVGQHHGEELSGFWLIYIPFFLSLHFVYKLQRRVR